MPGIQKLRAELLPAGAAILESVVTELGRRERLRGIAADLRT